MVYRRKDIKCPCDEDEPKQKHIKCHGKILDLCPKPSCLSGLVNNTCKFSNPPTHQEWLNYVNFNSYNLARCDPSCNYINFVYDFRMAYNPLDFDFVFGTDGVATADQTGLTVVSNPFSATVPVGNEHPKWLRYYKSTFPLCNTHEVVFEAEISAQQFIPASFGTTAETAAMIPRIRNVNDDIRLASAALNVLDPDTWMVFDFFMSNTAIYAFYERLPFGKPAFNGNVLTPLGDYAAFSNAIWVARRSGNNPLEEFSRLAIGIHRGKGIVTWYVDDTPVFSINTIGYRAHDEYRLLEHGGTEYKVDVKSVRVGFGTFSLLDMALPNNYARNYVIDIVPPSPPLVNNREIAASALVQLDVTPNYRELYPNPLTGQERFLVNPAVTFAYVSNQYPNDNHDVKLFGQGAALKIKTLRVYSRSDEESLEVSSVNH